MPWGSAPKCPACSRTVYPMEQVIAADRKPFHAKCIGCQMQGCRAELTERGLHRYEGFNICTNCHDSIFRNRTYGPGEGGETLEQKKAREEAERLAAEERERAKRERRCPECGNKVSSAVEVSPKAEQYLSLPPRLLERTQKCLHQTSTTIGAA